MLNLSEFLHAFLQSVYERCVERGMQHPFVFCAVGPNASILVMRFYGDRAEPDVLAERYEDDDGIMALPINIMIVSQDNEAVRVVIKVDDNGSVSTSDIIDRYAIS